MGSSIFFLIVAVCLIGRCCATPRMTAGGPVVQFPNGASVLGVNNGDTFQFLGIPFAQASRWADPQPAAEWSGQLNATVYGPYCPQNCVLPPGVCPEGAPMSEECLNLNVFTPSKSGGSRPVMVFFYGGGYLIGGQETPLYNGSILAASANPTVVVAINYRVGALGFLKAFNISGNFGMKDQIAALQWVQKHISSFGGDPHNVMVFGQSAGGMSTMTMVLSPQAAGLFHSAAIHSDPVGIAYCSQDEIEALSNTFLKITSCASDVSCLYNLDVDSILTHQIQAVALDPNILKAIYQTGAPWEPYIDGELLPGQPLDVIPTGSYNRMPIMLGSVQDEGTMFVYSAIPLALNAAEYLVTLKTIFGSAADTVHAMYPTLPSGQDNRVQLSQVLTDSAFVCPILNVSVPMNQFNPVWLWHFNHSIDETQVWGPDFAACAAPGQVCHGAELPFVFGTLQDAGYTWGPGEQALSQTMVLQWTNFALSGNPNSPASSVPSWPQLLAQQSPGNFQDLRFEVPTVAVETNYRLSVCQQWNQLGYGHGSYYGSSMSLARLFTRVNNALEVHRSLDQ